MKYKRLSDYLKVMLLLVIENFAIYANYANYANF